MSTIVTISEAEVNSLIEIDLDQIDSSLIVNTGEEAQFDTTQDTIELYSLDSNKNITGVNYNYINWRTSNDSSKGSTTALSNIELNPEEDGRDLGLYNGFGYIIYQFVNNKLSSNSQNVLYIDTISSDRTELVLKSNTISGIELQNGTQLLRTEIQQDEEYFKEFYIAFEDGNKEIATNIQYEETNETSPRVLIKLYRPLPDEYDIKSTLWIQALKADPVAYRVDFETTFDEETLLTPLRSPNFDAFKNTEEQGKVTIYKSYNDLKQTNLTSSLSQVNYLLNKNQAQLSIDYTNFSNFVHFSSAKKRLENFYYKASQIESYQNLIDSLLTSPSTNYRSGSVQVYQNSIDTIIKEFDGYDYFLYYDSGSKSWPKTNSTKPYILASTGSAAVLTWYGSDIESSGNYGGEILSASLYDDTNKDNLIFSIPSQLRDNSDNLKYLTYVEMIGQVLDELFLYTKNISSKYSSDNRLDYGSSKDLIADILRSLGLKLYENNFSSADLFSGLLGLTPSGSTLLLPGITTNFPVTGSGIEYIETIVSASNDTVTLDDLNKSIYKRLYHNLPALIKKKGTLAGLRLLINTYGISDTILRISEFGGKDKDNSNDWDYWQREYNNKFELDGTNDFVSTEWSLNTDWNATNDVPATLAFRFKTDEVTTTSGPTNVSQSLWLGTSNAPSYSTTYSAITLTYTGSAGTSGSYSGSVVDPEYQYGTLTFYPDYSDLTQSASIYLPFFDGGWWSVMVTSASAGYNVYAKNSIYNGDTGTSLGFQRSASLTPTTDNWTSATYAVFGKNVGTFNKLSGSLQELRYYKAALSESVFDDYVMNPSSIEGNNINSSGDELAFRGALGNELYTGSTSIHPKVSGEWTTTSSFASNSNITFSTGSFTDDTTVRFYDQPAVGIRNRISDKIRLDDNGVYGTTLSNQRSLVQNTPATKKYTRDTNYLEVGFSPQNEINDDIIDQVGYFNIGDYIGDPRQISSSSYTYADLEALKNAYFQKYSKSYDWNDYLRLIKFYDNSLFKMLKDFIPARTSAATGAVIKQTLLERNRQRPAQASWTRPEYTASIKPQSRDYETGSIEVVTGGTAGSLTVPQGGIETLFNSGSLTFSTGLNSYYYNLLDNATNESYTYTISFDVPSGYSDGSLMLFDATAIVTNPSYTPVLFSASMADITGTSQKFTAEVRNGVSISYFFDSINFLILTNLKIEHDLYDPAQGFPTSSINGLLGVVNTPFSTTPYYQGDFPGTTIDVVEGKLQDSPLLGESYRLSISDLQDIDVTVSQELRIDDFAFNTTQSVPFDTDAKNSFKYNTSTYTFTPEFSNIVDYSLILQGTFSCSMAGTPGPQSLIADLSVNGVTGSYPTTLFTVDSSGPTTDFTGSFTQSILISQDSLLELGEFKVVIYEGTGSSIFFPLTASFEDSRWTVTTENLAAKSTYYNDPTVYAQQNFPGNLERFNDYNAIYNNVYSNRVSSKYFDVDYSDGALNPSNFGPIISQSALYAQIQDSNYDSKSAFFEARFGGTKNTVSGYSTGSGLNTQYSAGVYAAYYSSITGSSQFPSGRSRGQLTIEYLISPEGDLIELTPNNEVSIQIFEQNFLSNVFQEGQAQVYALEFTESDFPAPVFKEQLTLDATTNAKPQFIGFRTGSEGGYPTNGTGGIIYPAGIEGTSAAELPFKAQQILKESRIL